MFRKLIFILVVALIVAGCAPAPASAPTAAPPTAAPAAGNAPAPIAAATAVAIVKLRSAYSQLNPDAVPLWIAQDVGYFKKNGLEVELIFIDGGTKHAQALISKDVQIGYTSGAPIVSADAAGAELVLIAGIVNKPNYDFIVQPSIKSAADLKGKKIAVSGLSGSSYTAARVALRELFKLDPDKDVTWISIGSEPEREVAMVAKQIDATVVNPDLSVKAKKDGLVVLDSLWGRDIPYQHTALATSKAFLKSNPEQVKNYVQSIVQAMGYFRDTANKADSIKIMSKYLKLDDQEVLESAYDRLRTQVFQCAPYVTLDGLKIVIGESKEAMEKKLTEVQVADNSFVKSLDENGFVKANCK
jgi:NitT/TauT family transport system substrate-binding protein